MKVAFLSFLLFFLPGIIQAQKTYVISGQVLNPQDLPLSKTVVSTDKKSTSTNSSGWFILETDVLPCVLTLKHPGYPVREEFVNLPAVGLDTVFVTFNLSPKGTDLDEVTVTASRIIWAYPKPHVHVIDFDLQGENMLLLCKDKKEYLVRLVDAMSEPLVDYPIRKHPKNFYRDCMGNVHIIYPDSSYQVNINDHQLSLINGQTTREIDGKLKPCALSLKNQQVYKFDGPFRQSVDYVIIDTLSDMFHRMYYAEDRKYKRIIQEYEKERERELRTIASKPGKNSVYDQMELLQLEEKQQMYRRSLAAPAYVPIFRLRDSIIIFDHLNDSAIVFTSKGYRVRSFPIIYQHHKKWDNELITNEEGTRLFARYTYGGMTKLMEIDPSTGKIIRKIDLEKHIYPSKIQIQGDFIYYIYHHYIDYSINYVYKQRIE